jgi:hypothetical protein
MNKMLNRPTHERPTRGLTIEHAAIKLSDSSTRWRKPKPGALQEGDLFARLDGSIDEDALPQAEANSKPTRRGAALTHRFWKLLGLGDKPSGLL